MPPLAVLSRAARYLAPIAIVSAIVLAPIALYAFRVSTPANAGQANVVLRIAWLCAGSGMLALLVLVGALAPILRAAASSERPSQLAVLSRGVRGLVRALVPAALVACAVAMGLLALAVPGVLIYALFVLAPASEADGARAKIADSVAIVRARWRAVAVVLAATMIALAAVVAIQQLMLPIPLGKSPPRAQLLLFPQLVRLVAIAMLGIVPMAALALAAIDAGARQPPAAPRG